VVGLVSEPAAADLRIYVRAQGLDPMAVAAMLAAARAASRTPPRLADRSN
jgi:hypothetical protein